MVSFANLASAQSSSKSYTRRLRRKEAFPTLSASDFCPLGSTQPLTQAMKAPINRAWQSNREAVIIHNVLYPTDSLGESGTSCTDSYSLESNSKVGGRKLQKKSFLYLSTEMLKPGRVNPIQLPPDYLDVEEASREATLLRISTLLRSRSTASQMQNGEAGSNVQKQGHVAQSGRMCGALSSHPVMVQEAVFNTAGPNVITASTRKTSTAVWQADHTRRNRRTRRQKYIKFKPVLESTEEKCERPDIENISAAAEQVNPPPRERVRLTHNSRLRAVDSLETTAEKCDRLEKERDSYIAKCEGLEQVTDGVYESLDSLKQELESRNRWLKSHENEIKRYRNWIQFLETEIAVELVKLDEEIGRGRLRKDEIRQLRDDKQRLRANIAGHSRENSPKKAERQYNDKSDGPMTHTQNMSPFGIVDCNWRSETEGIGHPLYHDPDDLRVTHPGLQNQVESSHQRFHAISIRNRLRAKSLIGCSFSGIPQSCIIPQAEMAALGNGLARPQPLLQAYIVIGEHDADTASEALRQEIDPEGYDLVAVQGSDSLPTLGSSTMRQGNNALPVHPANSNRVARKGAERGSSCVITPLLSQPLPMLDPDTSSEDEDIEIDKFDTGTLFRFGRPRVQAVRAVHRIRIAREETEQTDSETCLIPNLETWEWSSVPDLQLWDPKYGK